MPASIRRLLVIQTGGVEETVFLVPALRALRRALEQTEIHWLVSPRNRPLAALVPYVDRLIEFGGSPVSFVRLARTVRGARYDAVIDFEQRSPLTALVTRLSGAPRRVGFCGIGQARARAYTDRHWRTFAKPGSDEFLGLAAMLIPVVFDPALEMWDSEEGRAEADTLGLKRAGDGPLVVIHPGRGPGRGSREWPLADYAVLGNWLLQRHRAQLVITAGPVERKRSADLLRLLNGRGRDVGGQLSLRGTVSLLKRADLVISGDAGVMRLASALGRPQIALHGSTDSIDDVKAAVERALSNAGDR
jgi:ADP-heptose:LPS heptosyltransferase